MVVHPGHGNYSGTLINALLYHIKDLPANSNDRPGLVHRIDKDTSGLLVVAKTEAAMTHLSKQFFDKSFREGICCIGLGQCGDMIRVHDRWTYCQKSKE